MTSTKVSGLAASGRAFSPRSLICLRKPKGCRMSVSGTASAHKVTAGTTAAVKIS